MSKNEMFELVLDQFSYDDIIECLSTENFEKINEILCSMFTEKELRGFLEVV
jgi:hypothetical protein